MFSTVFFRERETVSILTEYTLDLNIQWVYMDVRVSVYVFYYTCYILRMYVL